MQPEPDRSPTQLLPGVDFTYMFTRSFYVRISQKRKNSVELSVCFCAFVIYAVKAASTMLIKLTPLVSFTNLLAQSSHCFALKFISLRQFSFNKKTVHKFTSEYNFYTLCSTPGMSNWRPLCLFCAAQIFSMLK